jgi:hypothetical protein
MNPESQPIVAHEYNVPNVDLKFLNQSRLFLKIESSVYPNIINDLTNLPIDGLILQKDP